jgi:hypothetical protein
MGIIKDLIRLLTGQINFTKNLIVEKLSFEA